MDTENTDPFFVEDFGLDLQKMVHSSDDIIMTVQMATSELLGRLRVPDGVNSGSWTSSNLHSWMIARRRKLSIFSNGADLNF